MISKLIVNLCVVSIYVSVCVLFIASNATTFYTTKNLLDLFLTVGWTANLLLPFYISYRWFKGGNQDETHN